MSLDARSGRAAEAQAAFDSVAELSRGSAGRPGGLTRSSATAPTRGHATEAAAIASRRSGC